MKNPLLTPGRAVLAGLCCLASSAAFAQTTPNNVGVGTTTPDASAVLDASSTTQGMLVPRMSATQRGLIGSPATGLLVYQTDAPAGFYFYTGTAWTALSGSGTNGTNGTPGTNGANGLSALVRTTPEAAGTNCSTGGTRVDSGQDTNGNTVLDAAEITATRYVCNGTNGTNGTNGAPGTAGTNGTNGAAGTAGTNGSNGAPGTAGTNGTNGQGVPTGGTVGQVLSKIDGANYNTQWTTPATAATTLYSGDGPLSANRTVGLNGKTLDFGGTGSLGLNGNPLRLQAASDGNHFLAYDAPSDGPILTGFGGGRLGYGTAGTNTGLSWSSAGVRINGGSSAYTLPTGRGTTGQVLTTDGSGAATWSTAAGSSGVSTQLRANKVGGTSETVPTSTSTTPTTISYTNVLTTPTLGSWDGSTYTVGAAAAGLYYIQATLFGSDASPTNNTVSYSLLIEVNNATYGSTAGGVYYGIYTPLNAYTPVGTKTRGEVGRMVYLSGGDTFKIRAIGTNSSTAPQPTTPVAAANLTVVKLN